MLVLRPHFKRNIIDVFRVCVRVILCALMHLFLFEVLVTTVHYFTNACVCVWNKLY